METYTYFYESPKSEIDLLNSLIKDVNLENKEELLGITDKVFKLYFTEQLHVIHCILVTMYSLSDDSIKNKNVESFLAQKVFKVHGDILNTIVDDDEDRNIWEEKILEIENKFNIKIKFEETSWIPQI
jgi:hypothetical protein